MPNLPRLLLAAALLVPLAARGQSVPKDLPPAGEGSAPAPAGPGHGTDDRPPVPATQVPPGRDPVELARAAAQAVQEGKMATALQLYGEWVDVDPLNPLARASYGSALYRNGRYDLARRELEKATLIEPKLGGAWATLGLLYDRDDQPWLALSAYTRAVHLEPRVAPHHVALALALAKRGWLDAAESELGTALEIDPKSSDAHFNLAALAVRRSPPAIETARRHYNEARKLGAEPDGGIESILHEAAQGSSPPATRDKNRPDDQPEDSNKKRSGKSAKEKSPR